MKRIVVAFALAMVLPGASLVFAQDKCTVSGEVTFQYDGDVYICLLTMEEFQDFNKTRELSQLPCKIIGMNTALKKAGKVSFTFDNIPKGTYCILTYQDVNMNAKVDFEGLDINKPWGSYKEMDPVSYLFSWETIRFELTKDITGITIEM